MPSRNPISQASLCQSPNTTTSSRIPQIFGKVVPGRLLYCRYRRPRGAHRYSQGCEDRYFCPPVPDKVVLRGYNPTYHGHKRQIEKALQMIAAAERPVIYAGGGVIISEAATVDLATAGYPYRHHAHGYRVHPLRSSSQPGDARYAWHGIRKLCHHGM